MAARKKTTVLAAGVFDILHLGHIHFLAHAKSLGDRLVVVVGSDQIARKAGKRPVHNEKERLAMIQAIGVVDKAVVGNRKDMLATLKKINPDIVFLGYDQKLEPHLNEYCVKHKIRVVRDSCNLSPGKYKTTKIKEKVIRDFGGNEKYSANALMHLAKKNASHCPLCRDSSSHAFMHKLGEEVRELEEAFRKEDYENVKEEIGDIIWDAAVLAHICEREGKFSGSEVIEGILKKIWRRKPFLIEGRSVAPAEARQIWQEAKRREKLSGENTQSTK